MKPSSLTLLALLGFLAMVRPSAASTAEDVDQLAKFGSLLGAAKACHLDTVAERATVERWIASTFAGPGQIPVAMSLLQSEQSYGEKQQTVQAADTCPAVRTALMALMG
jgi:hypothetical protein